MSDCSSSAMAGSAGAFRDGLDPMTIKVLRAAMAASRLHGAATVKMLQQAVEVAQSTPLGPVEGRIDLIA